MELGTLNSVLGIGASVITIASIILAVISTKSKNDLEKAISDFKEISSHEKEIIKKADILKVYENQKNAEMDMLEDLKKSSMMCVYGGAYEALLSNINGNPHGGVQSPFYSEMLNLRGNSKDIKILLLDPSLGTYTDYIEKRRAELGNPSAFIHANSATQETVRLETANASGMIKVSFHDEFPRYKFYIFDEAMYLGFMLEGSMSDDEEIYKIGKASPWYKSYRLQFDDYWELYKDKKLHS